MSMNTFPVRCREIADDDLPGIATLLSEGFDRHGVRFWQEGLERLRRHGGVSGYPRFGYLLESEGRPVGVLLLIFSPLGGPGEPPVRCNVSSWYVRPDARGFAPLLVSRALRFKDVQYVNITPAPNTVPIIEAQGYQRYADGLFCGVGLWSAAVPGCEVRLVDETLRPGADLSAGEVRLLLDHKEFGCLSVVAMDEGRRVPFVFGARRLRGILPYGCLYWCREMADFHAYARPLSRFLLKKGLPVVRVDANGPVPSLKGIYVKLKPKYYKGAWRPRLGDVAYTELAVIGC